MAEPEAHNQWTTAVKIAHHRDTLIVESESWKEMSLSRIWQFPQGD
jgi:hypothetical protein